MQNSVATPSETKNYYHLAISLLVIYPKEMTSAYQSATCTPMLTATLCKTAKLGNQLRYLLQMDGEDMDCKHNGMQYSHKKK